MTAEPAQGRKAAAPFVLMVKPVGSRCNLSCRYCYYLGTDARLGQPAEGCMSEETLEALIRNYMESSPGPVVSFTWHGGEPALAGLDFYRRAVALQKKYLPAGFSCWNSLQTNGVLLDDDWCDFLAAERFDVGLSLDGTAELHDAFRPQAGGGGSWEAALAAARRLLRRGVRPDLLCTVTSDTAKQPLAVYRTLRDLGTGWMQFLPIVRRTPDGRVTPDSVSPESYGAFLCDVFDEWVRHDTAHTGVQIFAEAMRALGGGEPTLCTMAPVCGRALVVEKDGSVYSCDHFVRPEYRLGNVCTDRLADLADAPRQLAFGQAKRDTLPARCKACRFLPLCGGGCPKDRFPTEDGEAAPYLCEGLLHFFSYAEGRLLELLRLQKSGLSPQEAQRALCEWERRLWQDVGRNDPCPCGSGKKAKKCCWNRRP